MTEADDDEKKALNGSNPSSSSSASSPSESSSSSLTNSTSPSQQIEIEIAIENRSGEEATAAAPAGERKESWKEFFSWDNLYNNDKLFPFFKQKLSL